MRCRIRLFPKRKDNALVRCELNLLVVRYHDLHVSCPNHVEDFLPHQSFVAKILLVGRYVPSLSGISL